MIQASTTSNPFLPEDYVQSLRDTYPGQLIDAYIDGEFVNLTSGSVYYAYDRRKNSSRETIQPETLYIGQDFNVGHMASTVYVQREYVWHAVAELVDMFDTPDVVRRLPSGGNDTATTSSCTRTPAARTVNRLMPVRQILPNYRTRVSRYVRNQLTLRLKTV